ncbi:hypothetical protein A9Q68_00830 [Streptococcus bovimastitidis]|uniref:Thiamine phosphate synthase/TenI domain-containing protein n=1 Tax=Streptococcus bovimastitidis TaxID=1856638 RepID=A0A1L8MMY8_9STRE|nr:hypothetical protein A9Q68_00830 [Streptococcus bovimastitidis]
MNKELLALYFICGSQDCPDGNLLATLEKPLKAGISLYQFREKGIGAKDGIEKKRLGISCTKIMSV